MHLGLSTRRVPLVFGQATVMLACPNVCFNSRNFFLQKWHSFLPEIHISPALFSKFAMTDTSLSPNSVALLAAGTGRIGSTELNLPIWYSDRSPL